MNEYTSRTQEYLSNRAQNALLTVLATGPVPKHVAFCMDGNRRYARRNNMQVAQGHSDGFLSLRRVSLQKHGLCSCCCVGIDKNLTDVGNMHETGRALRLGVCLCY